MKLFLSNLNYKITEKDVNDLFRKYNARSVKLIKDQTTGLCKGFGFIEIPDETMALNARKSLDGTTIMGRAINIKQAEEKKTMIKQNKDDDTIVSPYDFISRKPLKDRPIKEPIKEFNDRLMDNHYDIAFDITWETLTPTAANPCVDFNEAPCFAIGGIKKGNDKTGKEFTGYNKRWLTIGDRLAISPFTVKSAIANGFANLLGGCYRVNTKVENHGGGLDEGQYPYSGKYKRYRVSMNDKSHPGLLKSCKIGPDKKYDVKIQPVIEYYCDSPKLKIELVSGKEYFAVSREYKYKNIIDVDTLRRARPQDNDNNIVIYYGRYRFGMNLTLGPGELNKNHYHRFYKLDKSKDEKKGSIRAEHFESSKDLRDKVFLGKFKRLMTTDNRTKLDGQVWYEDLKDLKTALISGQQPWVYYQEFEGQITNIGKNFLFKALFLHEDTVPKGQSECNDHGKGLCPRCRMFGMTNNTDGEKESIGFKGRFKASALVDMDHKIKERKERNKIRLGDNEVPLKVWEDENGSVIAQQELLPISGPPKPNKRDIDGYFHKDTGKIKGAKYYLHGKLGTARNIGGVDDEKDYTHRLRSYAQVCESNIKFSGTVGAENCTAEEIAAFLILLHTDSYSCLHGFKIGLGKAFGMGSVKSTISEIKIRTKDNYDKWIPIAKEQDGDQDVTKKLCEKFSDIKNAFNLLETVTKKTVHIINSINGMDERILSYPSPERKKNKGKDYWTLFNERKLK